MLSARAAKRSVAGLGRRNGPVLFMSSAMTLSRRATSAAAAERVILGIRDLLLRGVPRHDAAGLTIVASILRFSERDTPRRYSNMGSCMGHHPPVLFWAPTG